MNDKRKEEFDELFTNLLQPRIVIPVTKEEMEQIQKCAGVRGMTVEQYVYEIVMKVVRA